MRLNSNRSIVGLKKRAGSASIMAIMVLTFLTISCLALQERLIDYGKSEWIDVESENLLRKAEGATLITEEKVVEATQRLYDISPYREDFKGRIESSEYRDQYVSEIEALDDVNMDNVKINVVNDDIAEDGSGLYKFWINITVSEKKLQMQRSIALCVTMKNLRKPRPIKEEIEDNKKPVEGENPDVNIEKPDGNVEVPEVKPEEDVVENINARDALLFRLERE